MAALASLRILWHTEIMSSISVPQKKVGRPATGESPRVGVRFDPDVKAALERYAAENEISVSEAVRRLVKWGLSIR